MVCKPDDKLVFQEEEFYTAFCEICGCWTKIYKFRSCEARLKGLEEKGIDPFKELRELEKLASYQTGERSLLPTSNSEKEKSAPSKKPSRRGR